MIRPYRHIPVADHEDALALAAVSAIRDEGWQGWEVDPLMSEARKLGVILWPALRDRLMREARG
jgi:hypothetical protein